MTFYNPSDAQIIDAIESMDGKISLPLFDGQALGIYAELVDLDPERAIRAVRNLLSKDVTDRTDMARHLLAHYKMMVKAVSPDTDLLSEIDNVEPTISTAWKAVRLGMLQLTQVAERPSGVPTFDSEKPLYIVLDLNVPWEREHSVVMSWEDGVKLVKVGEFGWPVHDGKLGEGHESCIFHCPEYELCTTSD
ncbi:MAG: hypothetical protein V3V31_13585 [Methylococcales bacterium]